MGNTITHKLVSVAIERGIDRLYVRVPEHEIDVLRAVHGPANVHPGDFTDEKLELPISADAEFARLQAKYRRVNAPDPVGIAHRSGPRSLEDYGFELGRGTREEVPQAGLRDHRAEAEAEAAAAEAAAAEAERAAAKGGAKPDPR
jgi:hypothetical protein